MFILFEYIDDWKKFNEISLLEKEEFYSHLNMEGITDADYVHAKEVSKDFDLYVQIDTVLLAGVFENFRNKCLEMHQLDPE